MTDQGPIDRIEARAKLKSSIDTLVEQTNLQLKMQKEPLKMLGGATGVGVALGVLVGRTLRRSRRIYVDAASSKKDQKALTKAQSKKGGSVGNALLATVATLSFKVLQERVIAPRIGEFADQLLEKSKQNGGAPAGAKKPVDLNKS
ncbi:hypothetical protein Q0M94_10415 [Deinococcus radiomollis]|uniref:hypothetical protein n=1 Tax=Deinococcus radiomollis TaxID=468916 RepID=UPI003892A4FD